MKKESYLLILKFCKFLKNQGFKKKTIIIYKNRVLKNIFDNYDSYLLENSKSFERQILAACRLWKAFISENMPQKTFQTVEIKHKPQAMKKVKDCFTLSLF